MTLARLYQNPLPQSDCYKIAAENAHIVAKVLRSKVGDKLEIFDGQGSWQKVVIEDISKKDIELKVLKKGQEAGKKSSLTLYQALAKGETFDRVLRQTTELGVDTIVPLISARTVKRPQPKKIENILGRWQKIIIEACRQSGRNFLPQLKTPIEFKQALEQSEENQLTIFFWEESKAATLFAYLKKETLPKRLAIIVGPEGGFSKTEAELAKKKGLVTLSLGENLLKVDTAAALAVGILNLAREVK